jgi:hypothetical protein
MPPLIIFSDGGASPSIKNQPQHRHTQCIHAAARLDTEPGHAEKKQQPNPSFSSALTWSQAPPVKEPDVGVPTRDCHQVGVLLVDS